jgi:hypothetical protein
VSMHAVSVWFPFVESLGIDVRSEVNSIIRGTDLVTAQGVDASLAIEFVHVVDLRGDHPWMPEWAGGLEPLTHVDLAAFREMRRAGSVPHL